MFFLEQHHRRIYQLFSNIGERLMKKEKLFMLIFIFLQSSAPMSTKAQVVNFQTGNSDDNIQIIVHAPPFLGEPPEHVQSIEVLRNGEAILKYTSPFFLQIIKKAVLVVPENGNGPYLLTVWTGGGPHNHKLFIFDLSLAPEFQDHEAIVHYYSSAWNVYLFPNGDDMEIIGERTGYYPNDIANLKEAFSCQWETVMVGDRFRVDCDKPRIVPLQYFYDKAGRLGTSDGSLDER